MSDTSDLVMPLLQKIQKDISESRRSVEGKINDIAETVLKLSGDIDALKGYTTYALGLLSQHRVDIDEVVSRVKMLEAQLAAKA